MYFFDELTGKETCHPHPKRVLVRIVNGIYVYGYTTKDSACIRVKARHGFIAEVLLESPIMNDVIYSNRQGVYLFKEGMTKQEIMIETNTRGRGGFPYTFQRRYEAIESFKIFNNRQEMVGEKKEHPISKYLKYSYGLEFETSEGYIPEHICYRDGLIPLRDGSITGLEYSTVVMNGNDGICLLEQQLKTLREYTIFDKECSLHIHFGNFPMNTDAIFNVYRVCKRLEGEIQFLVPQYTFNSAKYKNSGKDYCKFLPPSMNPGDRPYRSFEEFYEGLVGKSYEGSLTEPHPSDPGRERKWQIATRYFWVNFINILCYDVNKTIEFRLLRPSYNLEKITYWMYVFNAILVYSESLGKTESVSDISLGKIFKEIYDDETAENLLIETEKVKMLIDTQSKQNDFIGATIHLEDKLFNPDLCL
jgi:hypothetical protein